MIEHIIKTAEKGGWDRRTAEIDIGQVNYIPMFVKELAFLDPDLFKALGKELGWYMGDRWGICSICKKDEYFNEYNFCPEDGGAIEHYYKKSEKDMSKIYGTPIYHYLSFHETVYDHGFDAGIAYLSDLMPKE